MSNRDHSTFRPRPAAADSNGGHGKLLISAPRTLNDANVWRYGRELDVFPGELTWVLNGSSSVSRVMTGTAKLLAIPQ